MEISIYLARFWGGLFMILGVMSFGAGFLGRVIKYTDDKLITVTTGYITLILGLVTVTLHNIWVRDFRLAITLIGWITLIKGIEKVAFPDRVNRVAQSFKKGQYLWGFLIVIIGVFYYWVSIAI